MKTVKPILVLGLICFFTASALALTNRMTEERIYENENAAAVAARRQLLPEADRFRLLPYVGQGVSEVARADTGEYVVTGVARGYGGPVSVMAVLDGGGLLRIGVMETQETPGLGKKVEEEAFWRQFEGREAKRIAERDVDLISGATVSSLAVVEAVNAAIVAYDEIRQGG